MYIQLSPKHELHALYMLVTGNYNFTRQLKLTTILEGVSSRARVPRTGVAGALPLLHAFSYDVSENNKHKLVKINSFMLSKTAYKLLVYLYCKVKA
jgi:hypothetical protein